MEHGSMELSMMIVTISNEKKHGISLAYIGVFPTVCQVGWILTSTNENKSCLTILFQHTS